MTFTGEDSPMTTLLLSVMGAFVEFEWSLIRERQREGITITKQRGAYKGQKRLLSAEQMGMLRLVSRRLNWLGRWGLAERLFTDTCEGKLIEYDNLLRANHLKLANARGFSPSSNNC
jgi:DNA invertase Pin-like site-specific DNA recombinase